MVTYYIIQSKNPFQSLLSIHLSSFCSPRLTVLTFLLLLLIFLLLRLDGDGRLHLLDGGQSVRQNAGRELAVERRLLLVALPRAVAVECKHWTVNKNGPCRGGVCMCGMADLCRWLLFLWFRI